MDDHLIFDGKRYTSSITAAVKASLTNDYIARLCRQGRLPGRMVGKTWYVDEEALFAYLLEANKRKQKRKKALRTERQAEYRDAPMAPAPAAKPLAEPLNLPTGFRPPAPANPWADRAREQATALRRRTLRPERAFAAAFAIAVVLSTPLLLSSFSRGLAVLQESPLGTTARSTIALAGTSSAAVQMQLAVRAALRAEAGAWREVQEGVSFQIARMNRSMARFVVPFQSVSAAPSGYYAMVLTAVADSETLSVSLNIRELKTIFFQTVDAVKIWFEGFAGGAAQSS